MRRIILALLMVTPLVSCLEKPDGGFQGYIEGEYLYIAAPGAGRLSRVAVTKGTQVAAGAPLFSLEPTSEQAALDEAKSKKAQAESDLADLLVGSRPEEIAGMEAQLADAEASSALENETLARQLRLIATRVVSQSQVDAAQAAALRAAAQVARMKSQLATARLPAREDRIRAARSAVDSAGHAVEQAAWQRAQRDIVSPANALVDDVVRRPGEWVPANGVVISLLPPAGIKAVFFVPEPHRADFRPGANVAVTCTGCPKDLTASVSRIASTAEYTPPVIYSRETNAKLVFRMEAILASVPNVPLPGQPVSVRPP